MQQIHWSKLLCWMHGFTPKSSISRLNILWLLIRRQNKPRLLKGVYPIINSCWNCIHFGIKWELGKIIDTKMIGWTLFSMQHTVQKQRVHGHKEIWPLCTSCWEMISMKGFTKTCLSLDEICSKCIYVQYSLCS